MGWASAGDIFNPVAQALIDLDADDRIKRGVLGPLIDQLQAGDWDTEDESLDEFRNDPVIVELFRQRGVDRYLSEDAGPDGVLDYKKRRDLWVLRCEDHSDIATRPGTAEGHDELVREWAEHCQQHHGGDGQVDESMLINPGGRQ